MFRPHRERETKEDPPLMIPSVWTCWNELVRKHQAPPIKNNAPGKDRSVGPMGEKSGGR